MQTIRYTDKKGNNARVTDHPEWSASQPWVSYINGTAGRHFACPEDADAYLKEKGFSRVADWNMRVPVISTAHLPGSDAIVDLGVLYAAYDCGYFVWMDGTIEAPWFVAIREWADQQTNDGWVRFDNDADPVPELPTYNW